MTRIPGVPFVPGRNDYPDRDGRKYGITIHNTSNNASDEAEANFARRRPDGVSSHLYADRDSVTQSLELEARAGHVGSTTGNENAYAVEITGANGKSRKWWLENVAWDKLGRALAWMIRHDPDLKGFEVRRASVSEMRRNPKVKAFYAHDDCRRAWGHTTHTDPGPHFPWDRLFKAVNDALGATPAPTKPPAGTPANNWTEQLVKNLPTLKRGANGQAVRVLQGLMVAAGASTKIDGDFGADTERDLKVEQRQAKIGVDGIAGPNTYAVLLRVR